MQEIDVRQLKQMQAALKECREKGIPFPIWPQAFGRLNVEELPVIGRGKHGWDKSKVWVVPKSKEAWQDFVRRCPLDVVEREVFPKWVRVDHAYGVCKETEDAWYVEMFWNEKEEVGM